VALAVDDCEAVPLADWSPVVVVELVCADWSPVVVVAPMVDDWLPVLVVLSIVRLERPRRSMFGLKVEVDPVIDEFTSVEEPVTLVLLVELEPLTEGLAVALPLAVLLVEALADCESAMQSWWTALFDFSPALPVSLPASLPAFFFSSSLHSGLLAVGVLVVVCANAGAAASIAAIARLLRYLARIMSISCGEPLIGTGARKEGLRGARTFRPRPTWRWTAVHTLRAIAAKNVVHPDRFCSRNPTFVIPFRLRV